MRKKLLNDMNRLDNDALIEVLEDLAEKLAKPVKIELPDFPGQIAALEKKVDSINKMMYDAIDKLETDIRHIHAYLEHLKKQPADVNGDGKVDEKDLSVVHKAYSKAKKSKKKE